MGQRELIYTTKKGVQIFVIPGIKSPNDFIVKYKEPGKRTRTPKHIHLIIDLYLKKAGNHESTLELINKIINIIKHVRPANNFPPQLDQFIPTISEQFADLDKYGEYSVEFLLVIAELIMIQEKTNYPDGTLNLDVFSNFYNGADIFSIVSTATYRGGKK